MKAAHHRKQIQSWKYRLHEWLNGGLFRKGRFSLDNIYHCTVHKAGSQWIKAILSDARIRQYGLSVFTYQDRMEGRYDPRKITDRSFEQPFPKKTIVSPLYIDYYNYAAFPKPDHYRTIFIMRDPRDLVVSNYFSKKYSHGPMGAIPQIREKLCSLDISDGMAYIIDELNETGTFEALLSWAKPLDIDRNLINDSNVMVVRYEDLIISDNYHIFKNIFHHLDLPFSGGLLKSIVDDYRFEKLSGGRSKGNEDKLSHYRKGIQGDWQNYFEEKVKIKFNGDTGDLLQILGYEDNADW